MPKTKDLIPKLQLLRVLSYESFGPFTFQIRLSLKDGNLSWPVERGWFFGIPILNFLLPRSESHETSIEGKMTFDVSLHAPLHGGLIVRYEGSLTGAT